VENAIRIDNRINELHDVIKGEVGILKLKPQSLDLWRLLGEIVDEAAALAKQYRVEVRLGKLEDIPLVYADADRVRQVITNLLNNAFEYASQGGRVDINVSRHRSAVAFEMRDYGPGIAETKLSRLSSRQTRNTATGEHPGGLGIGLTLCKMLVELHGGKFWVKNRPGKGTSVCFTLTEYKVQANESAKG